MWPVLIYPIWHIRVNILTLKYHMVCVIVPNTVRITFNVDIESTGKPRNIVNNVGRTLVKKKVLMLGSKDIDTTNNSDIYETHNDLYLSEKEHEEKLLQRIQPANGLKARVGAKR